MFLATVVASVVEAIVVMSKPGIPSVVLATVFSEGVHMARAQQLAKMVIRMMTSKGLWLCVCLCVFVCGCVCVCVCVCVCAETRIEILSFKRILQN